MIKTTVFSVRNTKEIIRDRLNIAFGLGFPVILLLLLSLIQANLPVNLFQIEQLTPGIIVFGFSFLSLFSGMLIAKDRTSSFFMRLYTSPLTASHFIFSYFIPFIPLAIAQSVVCFLAAILLGLPISENILVTILVLIPAAVVFISIGLLAGSLLNDKQVGGVCGALLTNLSAWLSDTWFDIDLVGGLFASIAKALPFYHAVEAGRYALAGEYSKIFPDLWWVIGYAIVITAAAILVFNRKMNSDSL